jgi:CRISPR-associated protein Cas2
VLILVTYDVSTVEKAGLRRLRRVARACEDYGVRVQKSVFECQVGQTEWVQLKDRLLREIKSDADSLRFYDCASANHQWRLGGRGFAPGCKRNDDTGFPSFFDIS